LPPKKSAERRQNRATADTVVELVPDADVAPVPAGSPGWSDVTVAEWESFWGDDQLVSLVRDSQRASLVRLFDWREKLRDAWAQAESLRDAVGAEHMVTGSTGQDRANPLYDLAEKAEARALSIEARIVALEDRFGLSPGSMLKLGVDFQRRQNLAATNARIEEARSGGSDVSSSDDPRSLPGDASVDAG
jgi:hypothetical protein